MKKLGEIIEFSTKNNKYIYDSVSGEVIPSGKWNAFIIENYDKYQYHEMVEHLHLLGQQKEEFYFEYEFIKKLIEQKMFYYENEKKNTWKDKDIKYYINRANTSQLILVLTEKCNMRCEYCVYCEKYPKEMGYSSAEMEYETAKKGIDLYFALHREKVACGFKKGPMINFYGGEPLLKYHLIKKIVAYVESIDKNTKFYMTTNGLLLNKEVAKFITEHNFVVTFSLDGFQENHDRNRVTAGGEKTFASVVENIKQLQEIKKEKKIAQVISFNCCYDMYTDLEKCIEFFYKHYDTFYPFFTMFNQISPYDTSYYEWTENRILEEGLELKKNTFHETYIKIRERFFNGGFKDKRLEEIVMNLFTGQLVLYARNRWDWIEFNNSCIPLSKIAIYADGAICLCEKMNKKMQIGSVQAGIDFIKLKKISNALIKNFIDGACAACEARRICPACFMYMREDGSFNKEFCKKQKQAFKGRLEELYEILEKNNNFTEFISINNEFADILQMNH